jgi:hypothetical protein
MCIYEDCPYLCSTKKQHHSRFARMRRNKPVEIVKIPSPKVNWDVVDQLKISDKPIRKKRIDNDDEIELQ